MPLKSTDKPKAGRRDSTPEPVPAKSSYAKMSPKRTPPGKQAKAGAEALEREATRKPGPRY